jgi:hypothetical protein
MLYTYIHNIPIQTAHRPVSIDLQVINYFPKIRPTFIISIQNCVNLFGSIRGMLSVDERYEQPELRQKRRRTSFLPALLNATVIQSISDWCS